LAEDLQGHTSECSVILEAVVDHAL
jgi:hypothetical protein